MLRGIQMPDWGSLHQQLAELCKSQNVLIEQHQDAIVALEDRIINLEHDLGLVLSVIKDRKDST